MKNSENNSPNKKNENSAYQNFILRLDYFWKICIAYLDDTLTFFYEELGVVTGRFITIFSSFFSWLVSSDRSRVTQWPLIILKAVIGITVVLALALPTLVILFTLGTLSALIGLRNIANYSAKEQFAVYFILVLLLGIAPWVMSEYALFRITLILVYAVGLIGLDFLYGQCGIVSLATGGFLLTGGYLLTWLYNGTLGFELPLYIAVTLAALLNGIFGLLFGIPALRIKDHYLVIVSIAFTLTIPAILKSQYLVKISGAREGGVFLRDLKVPEFLGALPPHIWKYFIIVIPVMVLIYIAYNIIHHSQIGRALRSIKCDNEITMIFGIPVVYHKLLAFALSAVYAGFCGGFLVILTKFISPDSYGKSTSIDFLVANTIGGVGGILGNVFGGTFLAFEPDITVFVSNHVPRGKDIARVTYGVIVILIILFAPKGVAGEISRLFKGKFRMRPGRGFFMRSPPPDFDYLEEKKQYFPPK